LLVSFQDRRRGLNRTPDAGERFEVDDVGVVEFE
jgi:hypothetical protein